MPLLSHAPAHTKTAQFNSTVHKGGLYLQPSSRILAACLASLTALEYALHGPSLRVWGYGTVLLAVLPVAPYEIYCIFWINERVAEVGRGLEGEGGSGKEGEGGRGSKDGGAVDGELEELIGMWRRRNWGRAGPALAAGIAVAVIGSPFLSS